MCLTACTEPQCLYKGVLYLYSRAIPLLPLWALRPVQSLSACTRVHFTFTVELYLYSPYGPYGLYRASVPVQGCTLLYSRAIPLLPLWAVRPVQSLSACTRGTLYLYLYLTFYYIKYIVCLAHVSTTWPSSGKSTAKYILHKRLNQCTDLSY